MNMFIFFKNKKNYSNFFSNAVLTAEWAGIHKTTVGCYIKSGKLLNNKYYFKLTPKSIK